LAAGLHPDPLGELTALPRPPSSIQGEGLGLEEGQEGRKGRGRDGKEGAKGREGRERGRRKRKRGKRY